VVPILINRQGGDLTTGVPNILQPPFNVVDAGINFAAGKVDHLAMTAVGLAVLLGPLKAR
jgi:hypothetical protein